MFEVKNSVTICPCCGFKSDGVLSDGCQSCGARPVGEPLPRPDHEVPSYARSLVLAVTGTLMVLVFLTQTIIALAQVTTRGAKSSLAAFSMIPFDWKLWLAAGETAAWRLKWVMIPLTVLVLFGSRKLYRSMLAEPSRFCGQRYARKGYLASATVPLLILILIGVTVPTRLEHRGWGIEAETNVNIYRIDRALNEYHEKFGTLPSDLSDLNSLPDTDGSLAVALKDIDTSGYTVNSEVAAAPTKKPRPLRGAVIRNASLAFGTEETLSGGISFTDYALRLPGADKIPNTEDDLIVIDGVTRKISETPRLPGADKIPGTGDDLIVIDGMTYKVSETPRRGSSTTYPPPKRQP
jgi:hypothetical protein